MFSFSDLTDPSGSSGDEDDDNSISSFDTYSSGFADYYEHSEIFDDEDDELELVEYEEAEDYEEWSGLPGEDGNYSIERFLAEEDSEADANEELEEMTPDQSEEDSDIASTPSPSLIQPHPASFASRSPAGSIVILDSEIDSEDPVSMEDLPALSIQDEAMPLVVLTTASSPLQQQILDFEIEGYKKELEGSDSDEEKEAGIQSGQELEQIEISDDDYYTPEESTPINHPFMAPTDNMSISSLGDDLDFDDDYDPSMNTTGMPPSAAVPDHADNNSSDNGDPNLEAPNSRNDPQPASVNSSEDKYSVGNLTPITARRQLFGVQQYLEKFDLSEDDYHDGQVLVSAEPALEIFLGGSAQHDDSAGKETDSGEEDLGGLRVEERDLSEMVTEREIGKAEEHLEESAEQDSTTTMASATPPPQLASEQTLPVLPAEAIYREPLEDSCSLSSVTMDISDTSGDDADDERANDDRALDLQETAKGNKFHEEKRLLFSQDRTNHFVRMALHKVESYAVSKDFDKPKTITAPSGRPGSASSTVAAPREKSVWTGLMTPVAVKLSDPPGLGPTLQIENKATAGKSGTDAISTSKEAIQRTGNVLSAFVAPANTPQMSGFPGFGTPLQAANQNTATTATIVATTAVSEASAGPRGQSLPTKEAEGPGNTFSTFKFSPESLERGLDGILGITPAHQVANKDGIAPPTPMVNEASDRVPARSGDKSSPTKASKTPTNVAAPLAGTVFKFRNQMDHGHDSRKTLQPSHKDQPIADGNSAKIAVSASSKGGFVGVDLVGTTQAFTKCVPSTFIAREQSATSELATGNTSIHSRASSTSRPALLPSKGSPRKRINISPTGNVQIIDDPVMIQTTPAKEMARTPVPAGRTSKQRIIQDGEREVIDLTKDESDLDDDENITDTNKKTQQISTSRSLISTMPAGIEIIRIDSDTDSDGGRAFTRVRGLKKLLSARGNKKRAEETKGAKKKKSAKAAKAKAQNSEVTPKKEEEAAPKKAGAEARGMGGFQDTPVSYSLTGSAPPAQQPPLLSAPFLQPVPSVMPQRMNVPPQVSARTLERPVINTEMQWVMHTRMFDLMKLAQNTTLREVAGSITKIFQCYMTGRNVAFEHIRDRGPQVFQACPNRTLDLLNNPPRHRVGVNVKTGRISSVSLAPSKFLNTTIIGKKRPLSPDQESGQNKRARLSEDQEGGANDSSILKLFSNLMAPETLRPIQAPLREPAPPHLAPHPAPIFSSQLPPAPTGFSNVYFPPTQLPQTGGLLLNPYPGVQPAALIPSKESVVAMEAPRFTYLQPTATTGQATDSRNIITSVQPLIQFIHSRSTVNTQIHDISISRVVEAVYFARMLFNNELMGEYYMSAPPTFDASSADIPSLAILLNTPNKFMLKPEWLPMLEKILLWIMNVDSFEEIDIMDPLNASQGSWNKFLDKVQYEIIHRGLYDDRIYYGNLGR